jgi:hypothetical protein
MLIQVNNFLSERGREIMLEKLIDFLEGYLRSRNKFENENKIECVVYVNRQMYYAIDT